MFKKGDKVFKHYLIDTFRTFRGQLGRRTGEVLGATQTFTCGRHWVPVKWDDHEKPDWELEGNLFPYVELDLDP